MKCLNCGKEITKKSHKKGEVRKFCDKKCYLEYRGAEEREFDYTICQYCGKSFKESRDRPNLYCSRQCACKGSALIRQNQKEQQDEHNKELREELNSLLKKAEEIRFRLEYEKYCKICGKKFIAKQKNQTCCSPECSKRNANRNKDQR